MVYEIKRGGLFRLEFKSQGLTSVFAHDQEGGIADQQGANAVLLFGEWRDVGDHFDSLAIRFVELVAFDGHQQRVEGRPRTLKEIG